jgi:hypothetical protein
LEVIATANKTHSAIDVARHSRDKAYFPEKQPDEREKIVPPNIKA